jgi:hypothetical protein
VILSSAQTLVTITIDPYAIDQTANTASIVDILLTKLTINNLNQLSTFISDDCITVASHKHHSSEDPTSHHKSQAEYEKSKKEKIDTKIIIAKNIFLIIFNLIIILILIL